MFCVKLSKLTEVQFQNFKTNQLHNLNKLKLARFCKMLLTNPANDLAHCSINCWYDQFEKIAIKSIIVKLDAAVLSYLRDELVILPKECNIEDSNTSSELDFVGEPINFDEDDSEETGAPEFPEFSKHLMTILNKLGGSAFIKSNWHCALDAKWITAGQTLKVKDLVDIYQLLKASDKIKEDLNQPDVAEYCLVFKKWIEIHPGTEFRCFVKNHNLIGKFLGLSVLSSN